MTTAIVSHTWADGSVTAARIDIEDLLHDDATTLAVEGVVRMLAEAMALMMDGDG